MPPAPLLTPAWDPSDTPSWDEYFMDMCDFVARRSKDRSTRLGCVIVGPGNEIRTTGYNGFPRGIDDSRPERHERPAKDAWSEHAERNAIYNAARMGTPLNGCRLYVSWFPCMDCARAITQVGITEVIVLAPEDDERGARWADSFELSKELFAEAGLKVRIFSHPRRGTPPHPI
jgi:dCMP deaminase